MNKKFKDLVPGNSLYILFINPTNDELVEVLNCIVCNINDNKTVIGVQYVSREDKSKMEIGYFRVNPESYINESLKENKEHRMEALFETKIDAIDNYIRYCEDKIQQYKNNINQLSKI